MSHAGKIPARYQKPFPGKSAQMRLVLFLIHPYSMIKLWGISMDRLYQAIGDPTYPKRIAYAKKHGKPTLHEQHNLLARLEAKFGPSEQLNNLKSIFGGSDLTLALPRYSGEWAGFFYSQDSTRKAQYPGQSFIVALEQACVKLRLLLGKKDYSGFYESLQKDELLSNFLWPEVIAICAKGGANEDEMLMWNSSVAMEVHLSILAAQDVDFGTAAGTPETSWFSDLLPGSDGKKPTAKLFRWLKTQAGTPSINKFLKDKRLLTLGSLEESKVKRWSNGSHHPRRDFVHQISKLLFEDELNCPLRARDDAVRLINTLGYIAQTYIELAAERCDERWQALFQPWPNLPFGHTNFEEWCQARYPIWLEYHRNRLATGS